MKPDGQFVQTGHTLAGDVVKEEVNVPQEAVRYEDALRVATVKHAMLECLSEPMPTYLKPFESIIKAHFYDQVSRCDSQITLSYPIDWADLRLTFFFSEMKSRRLSILLGWWTVFLAGSVPLMEVRQLTSSNRLSRD